MIPSLEPIVPHLKALHIAALVLWCAGLFALPLMFARHDRSLGQIAYDLRRRATHYGYAWFVTPAALVAIASGTALVFVRELFTPWLFAKLAFVALLVAFHAWVGRLLIAAAETDAAPEPPRAGAALVVLLAPIVAILMLVLGKPDLSRIPLPGWLLEPRGVQLPFDVPRR